MVLKDLDDNRQTEPRSLGSSRYVRLNQSTSILARKSFAVVADGDLGKVGAIHRQRRGYDTVGLMFA
jgi:hypothetical protein